LYELSVQGSRMKGKRSGDRVEPSTDSGKTLIDAPDATPTNLKNDVRA